MKNFSNDVLFSFFSVEVQLPDDINQLIILDAPNEEESIEVVDSFEDTEPHGDAVRKDIKEVSFLAIYIKLMNH